MAGILVGDHAFVEQPLTPPKKDLCYRCGESRRHHLVASVLGEDFIMMGKPEPEQPGHGCPEPTPQTEPAPQNISHESCCGMGGIGAGFVQKETTADRRFRDKVNESKEFFAAKTPDPQAGNVFCDQCKNGPLWFYYHQPGSNRCSRCWWQGTEPSREAFLAKVCDAQDVKIKDLELQIESLTKEMHNLAKAKL